jgi:ATP-dependent DNA helicase PIF1
MDYCFETPEWKEANIYTVYFKQIHRQSDLEFIETLQKIRLGISDQETSSVLMSRFKKSLENKSGILPTQLYPTRDRANSVNNTFLENLKKIHQTKLFTLNISVEPTENSDERVYNTETLEQKILSQTPVAKNIELCKDLQVILVVNLSIDEGLVNGSKGIITDFDDKGFPIVAFLNGKVRAISPYTWDIEENGMLVKAVGIPLILGYGCTIHRSQGMTIELAIIDIGNNIFMGSGGYGQVYVALSRVRSLSGLCILNFDPNRIKCHPKVIRYYEDLEKEILERNKQDISDTCKPLDFTTNKQHTILDAPIKKVIKKSKEELKTRQFNIHTFFNPTVSLE